MPLEVAAIVADRLGRPRGELAAIQRELEQAEIWPRATPHQLALLLLTTLFGAGRANAVETACAVTHLVDADGMSAHAFVALMAESLITLRVDRYPEYAFHSAISCEAGDGWAVRIRTADNEGHTELTFTDAGAYRPHADLSVGLALQLPGRVLFRMCRDLAALESAHAA